MSDSEKAAEIEVTPEMVEAGMYVLGEHRFFDDWRLVLEDVYRAMAYEKPSASAVKFDK